MLNLKDTGEMRMEIEDQLVSFDLARRLEELGVHQDSIFYWVITENANHMIETGREASHYSFKFSAFSVAELGELLPEKIKNFQLHIIKFEDGYGIDYIGKTGEIFRFVNTFSKNLADALSKMLIYLIENNLLKL